MSRCMGHILEWPRKITTQITQCIRPISHNSSFRNRNAQSLQPFYSDFCASQRLLLVADIIFNELLFTLQQTHQITLCFSGNRWHLLIFGWFAVYTDEYYINSSPTFEIGKSRACLEACSIAIVVDVILDENVIHYSGVTWSLKYVLTLFSRKFYRILCVINTVRFHLSFFMI